MSLADRPVPLVAQASIRPAFRKKLSLADMRDELKALKAGEGSLFEKLTHADEVRSGAPSAVL